MTNTPETGRENVSTLSCDGGGVVQPTADDGNETQSTLHGEIGTQLVFEDTVAIETTPEELWPQLSNPAFLGACIPGVDTVTQDSERTFSIKLTRGIHRLTLSIAGEVELAELVEPTWMLAEGTGYESRTHTDFDGIVGIELSAIDDRTVELHYKAYLTALGGTASLPPRLVQAIVESDVDRCFEHVKANVEDNVRANVEEDIGANVEDTVRANVEGRDAI